MSNAARRFLLQKASRTLLRSSCISISKPFSSLTSVTTSLPSKTVYDFSRPISTSQQLKMSSAQPTFSKDFLFRQVSVWWHILLSRSLKRISFASFSCLIGILAPTPTYWLTPSRRRRSWSILSLTWLNATLKQSRISAWHWNMQVRRRHSHFLKQTSILIRFLIQSTPICMPTTSLELVCWKSWFRIASRWSTKLVGRRLTYIWKRVTRSNSASMSWKFEALRDTPTVLKHWSLIYSKDLLQDNDQ